MATRPVIGRGLVFQLGRLAPALALAIALALAAQAGAADRPGRDPATLLAEVKAPARFRVTLFAIPPDVSYPTCLAATPTGEVFVGVDENSSLDTEAGRGRVVRCADRDGDGAADEFRVFARMDSPRGLAWDAGTLYVLHPPRLSAYHDDDGDGVADRSEVLVEGIGFDLKFRGADHTTNGIRLAIDGWLYVAVGDYGFVKASGRDGRPISMRGGGVARVRTDGTGLETVSRGQRNIYDVAVDPYLDLFTRDNTNDGGGWDVRLSHVIPTGHYGYPTLFAHFADEVVAPLADYGGGSPTGSLYLQEPGFPAGYGDTLYTCEWGRSAVFRHPLTPRGAGFQAGQETFLELPRPTDIDVDGLGHLYVSSWRGGMFQNAGPDVGYVLRVTPEGHTPKPFPDLKAESDDQLVSALAAPGAVLRLAAQREILRRGAPGRRLTGELNELAFSDKPLAARVAAVFTLEQLLGRGAVAGLVAIARQRADLREFALHALADRKQDAASIPAEPFAEALSSADPRVRLQAVIGLGRLGKVEAAAEVVKRTADADPLVAHAAVQALVTLKAIDACLAAIDPATPALVPGACRALQNLFEARVVDGLIEKLHGVSSDAVRRPVLAALCRLYRREADWDGEWWGTRPDTAGPYFRPVAWDQTDRIGRALRDALAHADAATGRWLLTEMVKNRVELEDVTAQALELARGDAAFRATAIELFVGRSDPGDEVIGFLAGVASSETEPPATRARALQGLLRAGDHPAAREAALGVLASIGRLDDPPSALAGAWNDFVRDFRHLRRLDDFVAIAEGPDPDRGAVAYAVLLQANANPRIPERARQPARAALDRAWERPELAARLLNAVGLVRASNQAAAVRSRLDDPDPAVRRAAGAAARRLGLAGSSPDAGPTVARLAFDEVVAGVLKEKGDPAVGAQLFQRQGCVNCHTIAKVEGLKGPYLGDIANRYSRAELAESILKPSARIAQGFETQTFATTAGQVYTGFVVRESGEEVEVRLSDGSVVVLPKAEIEERGKSAQSVMPNGLADPLTVRDLASLIAYLESLRDQAESAK